MTNELIKNYIGKECKIITSNAPLGYKGRIVDVKENWLEFDTRKGIELINIDFIYNIKIN